MSFKFTWTEFNPEFYNKVKTAIESSLNAMPKPSNICAPFEVKDFYLGSKAPKIELLELAELSLNKLCALLRIYYDSNGYIVINTKIQANPISSSKGHETSNSTGVSEQQKGILAANKPLIVPMQIRISNLIINGIARLSIEKNSGLNLAFLNDPLLGMSVSSTFDSLPKLRDFLKSEIENGFRYTLLNELPELIYNLSIENPEDFVEIKHMMMSTGLGSDKRLNDHEESNDHITSTYERKSVETTELLAGMDQNGAFLLQKKLTQIEESSKVFLNNIETPDTTTLLPNKDSQDNLSVDSLKSTDPSVHNEKHGLESLIDDKMQFLSGTLLRPQINTIHETKSFYCSLISPLASPQLSLFTGIGYIYHRTSLSRGNLHMKHTIHRNILSKNTMAKALLLPLPMFFLSDHCQLETNKKIYPSSNDDSNELNQSEINIHHQNVMNRESAKAFENIFTSSIPANSSSNSHLAKPRSFSLSEAFGKGKAVFINNKRDNNTVEPPPVSPIPLYYSEARSQGLRELCHLSSQCQRNKVLPRKEYQQPSSFIVERRYSHLKSHDQSELLIEDKSKTETNGFLGTFKLGTFHLSLYHKKNK